MSASPGGRGGGKEERVRITCSHVQPDLLTWFCSTYVENLVEGVLHVLTAQQGVFEFGGGDVVFPDERHHQNVFLQQHHLRTGNLRLLHPDLTTRTFIHLEFV